MITLEKPTHKSAEKPLRQLRANSVVHGDFAAILPHLKDEEVDLTVFSPPYDNVRDYKGGWSFDYPTLGKHLYRVTKDGGMCAVVIGDGTKDFAKSLTTFRLALDWCDNAGWRLFENCIYYRDGNPGAWWKQRFRVDHEYVLLFLKGAKPKTFNKEPLMVPSKHAGKMYGGTDRLTNGEVRQIVPKEVNPMKCRGTVWRYSTSNIEGNRTKLQHPATFPDKLAEDLILCFSEPGDLVLDPTMGSGTTCVMSARNQRRYLGIDISEEYCAIAQKRIDEEISGQLPFWTREAQAKYDVTADERLDRSETEASDEL